MLGEKNPLWKGGISPENNKIRGNLKYQIWVKLVFKRDNYTCKKTSQYGGKLTAHHIKNFAQYPELRFDINNGITLSFESHKEFHNIYGKRNNTQEQLIEFLLKK